MGLKSAARSDSAAVAKMSLLRARPALLILNPFTCRSSGYQSGGVIAGERSCARLQYAHLGTIRRHISRWMTRRGPCAGHDLNPGHHAGATGALHQGCCLGGSFSLCLITDRAQVVTELARILGVILTDTLECCSFTRLHFTITTESKSNESR